MQNRIKELRKSLGMNQTEFGKKLGVTTSAISGYELGTIVPSTAIILSICREFGVSETWLRTGEGEMFPSRSREEELGRLVADLFADSPATFRSALITTLLRFDPAGPEWAVLEAITKNLLAEWQAQRKDENGVADDGV
jgi:transcriptional regulator with XRE-family HTH domain